MVETKSAVPNPKVQTSDKEVETRSNPRHVTPQPNLFGVTVNADTGEILKVEKVEGTGARRDLRDEDLASLAATVAPTLSALLEQVFEAGIACMLGVRAGHDEPEESAEEADLRRALLTPLMEGTLAIDALKTEVLGKAILASAIAQVAAARAATPGKAEDAAIG